MWQKILLVDVFVLNTTLSLPPMATMKLHGADARDIFSPRRGIT